MACHRTFSVALTLLLVLNPAAHATELRVASSAGFSHAYLALVPEFEKRSGVHVESVWGPSMGATHDTIPARLARGEKIDVVIMAASALEKLAHDGKVDEASRVVLASAGIGAAVRAGAAKPDISSADALKRALLAARSVAYSDSASGVYIAHEMLPRLGLAGDLGGKARMIPAEPVGQVVARGEAELGFQTMSELLPIPGIDIVGPLPPELQRTIAFAAGIVHGAAAPEAAQALIAFLASPDAAAAIRRSGMEPIGERAR